MRTNRRQPLGRAAGGTEEACCGVEAEGSLAEARARMTEAGVKRIRSGDLQV